MPHPAAATLGGVAAILIWSSCVSVARLLSESLGIFTSAAAIFLLAGIASLSVRAARPGALAAMFGLPRPYLLGCGALFVCCQIGLYGGLGVAVDRLQVLEVGAINYLWPAFTLLLGVPILGLRARWWLLALGALIACAGVFLVTLGPQALTLSAALSRTVSMPAAYALALGGSLCWSLYSSLARRLAGAGHDAIPLFLFASGVALLALRLTTSETTQLSPGMLVALVYAAGFIAWGAYALWDVGVRRGDFSLLSALSYAIPVLSTLLSCLVLRVRPPHLLWAGVFMVSIGAVIGNYAVISEK